MTALSLAITFPIIVLDQVLQVKAPLTLLAVPLQKVPMLKIFFIIVISIY